MGSWMEAELFCFVFFLTRADDAIALIPCVGFITSAGLAVRAGIVSLMEFI